MAEKRFFVHYTVSMPPNKPQRCTAGPYSEDEVMDQRRDIAGYAGISDCYVSESPQHEERG